MNMRKLVAALMAVLMLCSIVPFSAMAEGSSASIDFGDKANRVSYSTEQQVWAQNGLTVTNDKAASNSNVGDYGGDGYPVRFYQSSSVTIAYPGMTKIVVNCDDYKASYPTALESSISGADVSVDGFVVTITLPAAADTFVIESLSAQVRVDSITVYTGEAGGTDTPVDPPEEPPVSGDPEADTELSIADAIALGTSKEHNVYTESKYYVSGVITEVYNTQYGNMKITDDAGNILTIYGTYSADGSARYDAMDVKPVAGDTVKIYGIVGQYNGTAQIKNGWIVEHTAAGGTDTPVEPPVEPTIGVVDAPVAGTAYKFGMVQGNVSATDVYYLIGGMAQTYYLATGTDASAAIDVYLEETEGGYYMYTLSGETKTYINMVVSGTHVNGAYEAAASTVYTFNAESKTVIAIVNDTEYWFGTRNDKTYTTVGPCAVSYAGFYCQFYTVSGGDTPVEPPVSGDPEADTELSIADAIALGLSKAHNVYTTDKYYVTGVITEVYNTQYGNMKITDDAGNILTIYGTYSADGSTRYDALEVQPVAGDTVKIYGIVGQYNDVAQIKNGWIVEHTAAGDTPVEPPVSEDPEADTELSIADAIALGLSKAHNVYTTGKYYVSGVITEVYNTQYGNMKITDDAGNILTIYGTYSADGSTRYDALEVKPEAGDTVKIYGIIGQYNDVAQIKNGWIVEHTAAGDTPVDPPVEPPVETTGKADFETIVTPNANGDSKYTNTYTTTNGWVTENSAIQTGGASVMNPQFPVIGPDNTYKAVCMNGKVGAAGKITSPTLTGGISKLTLTYTKMFTDTKLSVTVTITDLTTGAVYTRTVARDVEKDTDKYVVWTDEWVLETPIAGDFTIEIVNDCPSAATGNKDRFTVLGVEWAAAAGDTPVDPPVEFDGSIVVSTTEGSAGDTVSVTVSLPENPGIVSAKVKVLYDTTVLKLVSYEAGNFSAGGYSWGELGKEYFIVNWCDAINPDSTADLLATLNFEILEGAADGFTAITLEFSCDDDMFNAADETVWFEAVDGGIEIVTAPVIPGDANGDGKANNRDLGVLQQYLNEWEVSVDEKAADLNGDGKVNNRDLGMLQQLLNA